MSSFSFCLLIEQVNKLFIKVNIYFILNENNLFNLCMKLEFFLQLYKL